KPNEAIREAEKLLWGIVLRQKEIKSEVEEWRKRFAAAYKQSSQAVARGRKKPVRYNEAVKFITRECLRPSPKFYRARDRFKHVWAFRRKITYTKARQQLREYEAGKKHIKSGELGSLGVAYDAWESKKKKGKRGRVKNPATDKRKQPHVMAMP